jgi:ATP/ADP translocase
VLEFKNYNLYNIIIYQKFINNLLNLKIFNIVPSCWLLFFIGFPYINYFMRDFLDYMWVTPIGKIITGSYKLLVWITKIIF